MCASPHKRVGCDAGQAEVTCEIIPCHKRSVLNHKIGTIRARVLGSVREWGRREKPLVGECSRFGRDGQQAARFFRKIEQDRARFMKQKAVTLVVDERIRSRGVPRQNPGRAGQFTRGIGSIEDVGQTEFFKQYER